MSEWWNPLYPCSPDLEATVEGPSILLDPDFAIGKMEVLLLQEGDQRLMDTLLIKDIGRHIFVDLVHVEILFLFPLFYLP